MVGTFIYIYVWRFGVDKFSFASIMTLTTGACALAFAVKIPYKA
jgi:hypothetical protein